jgi:hypothetical protein
MAKTTFSVATAFLLAFGLAACDVEQTQEGKVDAPEYEVAKTDEGEVQAPKFDVATPDVDVSTEEKTVEVPEVQTEEKKIEVPDVDVNAPKDQ